jgi:hypothetical protein
MAKKQVNINQFYAYADIGNKLASSPEILNFDEMPTEVPKYSMEYRMAQKAPDIVPTSMDIDSGVLDNMFNMFQKRKKQIQTTRAMPGQSQLVSIA